MSGLKTCAVKRAGLPGACTRRVGDGAGVGAEQRGRGQHRGRDRDALGDRLGGVADRVELGEDLRALAVDVAGHLRDALGVVGDGAEGVHRDDHADGGEQAAAGQGDREQRDRHDARAEQERAEHRGADDQGGEDRRLEADREAGEDHRRRTGQRGLADVDHRAVVGAGVVAGQRQDHRGERDADQHGDGRDHPRVATVVRPAPAGTPESSANEPGR